MLLGIFDLVWFLIELTAKLVIKIFKKLRR